MKQLNFPAARPLTSSWRGPAMALKSVLMLLTLLVAMSNAMAGQFFERNGAAIDGYDPVAYFTDNKAMRGDKAITATHKESTFYFSSAANRDLFVANPDKYAPQFDGFCAYGVAQGAKVKIEGDRFAVVNGKLYLNYDKSVQAKWNKDIPGFIKEAEGKWPTLK